MSLFLSFLPASATEQSIRTRVVQSLPALDPSQIKSVVHVAKSKSVSHYALRMKSLRFTDNLCHNVDALLSISRIAQLQKQLHKHGPTDWI
jgi:hypothetical protein